MRRSFGWITQILIVSRPLLWPATLLPFLIGGYFAGSQHLVAFWLVALTLTVPYHYVLYGINDAFDVQTDSLNDRKQAGALLAGQVLSVAPRRLVYAAWVLTLGTLVFVLAASRSVVVCSLYVLLFALGVAYSVPPVRLKERVFLDSFSNGFLYFLLPFALGFSVAGQVGDLPTLKLVILAIAVGGFHLGASALDIEADKQAGMRTSATVLGFRGAVVVELLTVLLGFIVLWSYPLFRVYLIAVAVVLCLVFCYPKPAFARYMGYVFLYGGFVVAAGLFLLMQILKI